MTAQALDNVDQIRYALEQAVDVDPQHTRAAAQLAALKHALPPQAVEQLETTDIPSPTAKKNILPLPAAEGQDLYGFSRRRSSGQLVISLLLIFVGTLIVIGAGFLFFRTVVHAAPAPILGPYYTRYTEPYQELTTPPCITYTLFGRIKNNPQLAIRVWTDFGFDQRANLNINGEFQFDLPPQQIFRGDPQTHQLLDPPVRIQLFDNDSTTLSGIHQMWFGGGCALYTEFWRYESQTTLFNPPERTDTWTGAYQTSISELAGVAPLLDCDFSGFVGTIHDDQGPVNGMAVRVAPLGRPDDISMVISGENERLDEGGWAIDVPPNEEYVLNVYNINDELISTQIVSLPTGNTCSLRVIEVAIIQADRLIDLPPLPSQR